MEKRKKIATKLILGIVIFSGFISLIITVIQIYSEFQRDIAIINTKIDAIKQTSLPSLEEALWVADQGQIQILLSSIQKNDDIGYVELISAEGKIYHYGNKDIENSLPQNFNLLHNNTDKLGSLLIKADLSHAYIRLYDRIGFVLISNILQTLLVGLFIYFLMYHLVVRHLSTIANYLRTFKINEANPQLCLNRGKLAANDEFRELVTSVNTMTHNLDESVQKLVQSEEKIRLLLESTAEAIYGINLNGECIFANPACIKILGYDNEDELLGKNMHELIHHSHSDGTSYPISECKIGLALKESLNVHETTEVFWRKDATSFNVDYRAQPIYQKNDLTGAVISFIDITLKLKNMRELEEANHQAQEANRAKSDFLANMSHEIRTPMNAILGMTNLAIDANPDKQQQHYLDRIDTAATSLLRIINDILDFSKIEAGKLDMEEIGFKLTDVINNVVSISGAKAKQKGLNLNIHIDDTLPPVLTGDPLRLNQILLNLINNAIKFTETGDIEVHIKLNENTGDKVELLFQVRDTGIGLSDEEQIHLFEPFVQADSSTTRQYGGSGLGLTICKHLVNLMNGTIGIKSIPDVGSTFYFNAWFEIGTQDKLSTRDDLVIPTSIDVLHEKVRGSYILLVEDNEINQELAVEILSKAGIQIDIANNGQEAVNMLSKEHHYDGVLMDIQMPIMSGYDATDIIRNTKNMKDLPIIAMTANAMRGDREKCLAAGMNDYVSKPVNTKELFNVMARWISPANPTLLSEPSNTDKHEHEELLVLPGVDIEMGLKYMGNSYERYKRFLVKFRNGHHDFVEKFSNARTQDDNETAHLLAHTFKSLSAMLGAEDLRKSAEELEQLAVENDQDNAINTHIKLIKDNLEALVSAIDSL